MQMNPGAINNKKYSIERKQGSFHIHMLSLPQLSGFPSALRA
jgi:hypothetical protein